MNASEFFTQDIEDMDFARNDVIDVEPRHVQPTRQPMPQAAAIPVMRQAETQQDAAPNTVAGAKARIEEHAKAVTELMNATTDPAKATMLDAALSEARQVYGDRMATIGDLHRAADTLKALHTAVEAVEAQPAEAA